MTAASVTAARREAKTMKDPLGKEKHGRSLNLTPT
jgi:hypothetical protein